MVPEDAARSGQLKIDTSARPEWLRTGYKFFPYAAIQSGKWWVLRFNYGFPEHDLYTLFIDGDWVGDITGAMTSQIPLVAIIGALKPELSTTDEPTLDPDTAASVVTVVAPYVNYGSERNDPCIFCSENRDGMTLA
ncbi:hypothetical protein [[Mycobacterium] nativiensis]|uniref:Uncharacterized protein n=1 Tax=[Mycobacterium] nativiensis TaxID=2855503 RepID=A0ABU5XXL4_9MYCO|nr:hypothetical protein [Mycolicibacter sp. MYC340]MEB3032543.1 hypothetical protein [Mycolicibacter sp. MYC340]